VGVIIRGGCDMWEQLGGCVGEED